MLTVVVDDRGSHLSDPGAGNGGGGDLPGPRNGGGRKQLEETFFEGLHEAWARGGDRGRRLRGSAMRTLQSNAAFPRRPKAESGSTENKSIQSCAAAEPAIGRSPPGHRAAIGGCRPVGCRQCRPAPRRCSAASRCDDASRCDNASRCDPLAAVSSSVAGPRKARCTRHSSSRAKVHSLCRAQPCLTVSISSSTFSTGVPGSTPWPRLKMWPGRPAARASTARA